MAKGIAVVSGSNNVVFKALETGVIAAGSYNSDTGTGTLAVVTITGSLGVTELVTLEKGLTLNGGDILVLDGKVSASSNLEAGGILDVEGVSNLKGTVTVEQGNLVVSTGTTTLADKLTVSAGGAEITGEVSASSNLKAGGNLDVEGTSNLKGKLEVEAGDVEVLAGAISASSNLSAGGNLDIEGTSNLKGLLTVEVGGADITGNADLRNDVVIQGDLEVKGATTVTTDSISNMKITDAVTLLGDGADADAIDIGFILGSSNSKALISDNGVFRLGSTSQTAADDVITVANDGVLVLGQMTASVGVLAKDVYIQDSLTVEDNVILGQNSSDTITLNGVVTATSNVVLEEDVTIGTFTEGAQADDLLKVVGQIRMPIFTTAGDALTGSFPIIPADYVANKANYNGHMFYLTGSDSTNWTTTDAAWPQANKWYFNERGDWHASFLFAE
jgi:hypothetical protein